MIRLIEKYRRLGVTARASIWFVFCNLMMKGISVITVPLFTRLLTTEQYGTYSLYISWFNILTIFTSLNLYYGVFNNAMNRIRDPAKRDIYVSSMQGLVTALCLVLTAAVVPFAGFWSRILGLSEAVLFLMLLHLWVEPCSQFWLARQRFEFNYRHAVVVTLLKSALNPLLGLWMVLHAGEDRAFARILSVVLAELFVAGSIMVLQFFRGRTFYHKKHWKYALGFNIPLLPHYLSMVVLAQSDRVMIEKLSGKSSVGIYSVAYSIGMLVQLFTNAINSSLTPWTYEKLNGKKYSEIRKNTNMLLALLAGLIFFMLLFVPEAVAFFASREYYEAVYVVPPVACSVFFIFLYNIFAIPQMYFERQKAMSAASAAAALLNLILNYIFIGIFGYVAAGYTTVACYLVYSIGHYLFSRRTCMEKIGSFDLYDEKAVLFISLFMLAVSIGVNFLFPYRAVRLILALLVTAGAWINRKKIVPAVISGRRKSS